MLPSVTASGIIIYTDKPMLPKILILAPLENLHLYWTIFFHVHSSGTVVKCVGAEKCVVGGNGTNTAMSDPTPTFWWRMKQTAAMQSGHGRRDIKPSAPFLDAPRASSQHQVRHLARANAVDSESKWHTQITLLTSQKSQTTTRRSSASQHLRFHSGVITWLPPCDLFASPKLGSPVVPTSPVRANAHKRKRETGLWGGVLYNNGVCECSNASSPPSASQATFYWSYTDQWLFYFICV